MLTIATNKDVIKRNGVPDSGRYLGAKHFTDLFVRNNRY